MKLSRVALALLMLTTFADGQPAAPPATAPAIAPQRADVAAPKVSSNEKSVQRFHEMHDKFIERARQGNIDLLFLGDSITEGWAGRGKETWAERYAKLNAANFGISGDRTQHVLWRIENGELENIKPKVAVLMIGTNNVSNSGPNPSEEIAAGVGKIVQTIRDKTGAKVLLLAVFPRGQTAGKSGDARSTIDQINGIIAKLDDGKNVRYLDLADKFLEPDQSLSKEIMPDFLHLSEKGYQRWADGMQPLLDEMMK
jgi:lysophospholipase L1-like esterase